MSRTIVRFVLPWLLVATGASAARAEQTFEAKAASAIVVDRLDEVVWALSAACDQGDDQRQRQCRVVRDAAAKQLAGKTLLVDADATAFAVGPWKAATRSVSVAVTACIRCGGLPIDGRTWYVTGAPARLEAGKLSSANLYDSTKLFPDEPTASAWLRSFKDARVQMVVKVPAKRRWLVAGREGLLLETVAYRVVAPCTGAIAISSPASSAAEPDKSACPATAAAPVPSLTPKMVKDTMQPVVAAAKACYAKFKVAGKARLQIGIAADGSVAAYDHLGPLKGTPTGNCIDAAMAGIQFPPSQRPQTTIGFPIVLP